MAEEETNSRIEELKARLEADPGSRVFYQLGEELRKSGRAEEAETVLRAGLEKHPVYLSALISLGRVLKETSRSEEAIEVLNRAFDLDRQNVVVARILGEAYSETGEHVEAIKKYKLVAALHPADEDVQERISELENVLQQEGKLEGKPGPQPPGASTAQPEPEPEQAPALAETKAQPDSATGTGPGPETPGSEVAHEDSASGPAAAFEAEDQGVADDEVAPPEEPVEPTDQEAAPQDTAEPSREEAEPYAFGSEVETEEPAGAPQSASSDAEKLADEEDQPLVDEDRPSFPETGGDVVATVTMGDLYARQGHVEQAREIYRKVLAREPGHPEASARLSSLEVSETGGGDQEETWPTDAPAGDRESKVQRLEEWLSKVSRS